MTTYPNHDYAPFRCKTHNKAYCEECMTISSSANDAGLVIKQTAYDKIHRVDFSCSTHADSSMIYACKKCVKEQLKEEYERGKKEAQSKRLDETKQPDVYQAGYKGPLPDSPEYLRGLEDAKKYFREVRDLRKDYGTLKQHYEKAREQIEFAHRIVNMMKESCRDNQLVLKNIKEWEAL